MGFFDRFSSQQGKEDTKSVDPQTYRENFISETLTPKRYMFCIEKCYLNFRYQLEDEERVCLAQCADRIFDRYDTIYEDLRAIEKAKSVF